MNHFTTFKQLFLNDITKAEQGKLLSLIKFTRREWGDLFQDGKQFITYTYTIKHKNNKRAPDDQIYDQNPNLLKILPRGCTLLVTENRFSGGKREVIVGHLEGSRKFSGYQAYDDDQEEGKNKYTTKNIFKFDKIKEWAENSELTAVHTEKKNGKNCLLTIVPYNCRFILLGGSKNFHVPIPSTVLRDPLLWNKFKTKFNLGNIVEGIFEYYITMLPIIFNSPYLITNLTRYTMGGEYCDGQHFTDGDNKVYQFGLFDNGVALNPLQTLLELHKEGLDVVPFKEVYGYESEPQILDGILKLGKLSKGEGGVTYLTNIVTEETILVKDKAVGYIVKRMMRQILMRGTRYITDIQRRIKESVDYHNLNTSAAIRITKKLQNFAKWFVEKKYPTKVLGVTEVSAVKGKLENGFYKYWSEFMQETGISDIIVEASDLGRFDANVYERANLSLYDSRPIFNRPLVIFFQGLQGSGKSTLGAKVVELLTRAGVKARIFEQDDYWGDSNSCQGAIYHEINNSNGGDVILITRCNFEPKQYNRYLDIAHQSSCKILFFSPKYMDPLYYAVSMAGIIKRSGEGDQLMVGRYEYEVEEVANFTYKFYKSYSRHYQGIDYVGYINNHKLSNEAAKNINNLDAMIKFIKDNKDNLNQLRLPIRDIAITIVDKIMETMVGGYSSDYVLPKDIIYSGFFLNQIDHEILKQFCMQYNSSPGEYICHHCTQKYYGKKGKKGALNPFDQYKLIIDKLVIRKSDGAMAFSVKEVKNIQSGEIVTPDRAHITAFLPPGVKAMESRGYVTSLDSNIVDIVNWNAEFQTTSLWI